MKKLIIIFSFIMFLALSTSLNAQTLGVRGGVHIASMLWEENDVPTPGMKSKLGMSLGGVIDLPVENFFSFQTGLIISLKGMGLYNSGVLEERELSEDMTMNMVYLDIPLAGKANFKLGGVDFYGLLGPSVGIGIIGKYNYEGHLVASNLYVNNANTFGSKEMSLRFKRLELGGLIGLGCKINKVQIGLQYDRGLTSIGHYSTSKIKNRSFQVNFTYMFLASRESRNL